MKYIIFYDLSPIIDPIVVHGPVQNSQLFIGLFVKPLTRIIIQVP